MGLVAYYILGLLAVISASFMITRRNPVHSALWMLLTFFSVAGIFVQLDAEYIAAIQILVYAGAILVLYLFVVMILNPKTKGMMKIPFRYMLGIAAAVVVLFQVLATLGSANLLGKTGTVTPEAVEKVGYVKLFGVELFTTYLVPFEIASLLLLVAMIGAIVIAKKD